MGKNELTRREAGKVVRPELGEGLSKLLSRHRKALRLLEPAGEECLKSFVDFFTAELRNNNTREAYGRAVTDFLAFCQELGIDDVRKVETLHVSSYIEMLKGQRSAPTVKQHLAAVREFFNQLVRGHVMRVNPAAAVKGPRYSVSKGLTPVLAADEARMLLKSIDISHVVGLRDRALIALLTYTFARVSAAVGMRVEDYYPGQKKRWWVRLHEKNGKLNEMPCHHNLEDWLGEYIEAAGMEANKKGWLFRTAEGRSRMLSAEPMSRNDAYRMIRRRAKDAGLEQALGCHSFRATGITDYLRNGGKLEIAQRMAGHSNAKTTGLYDRRNDDISLDEVELIRI